MKANRLIVGTALIAGLTFGGYVTNQAQQPETEAARVDMIDMSNHNIKAQPGGYIGVDEYVSMRNNYGVKAITTKITEGTGYHDPYAAGIISNSQKAGLYINGYYFCQYTNVAQKLNMQLTWQNKMVYQLMLFYALILKRINNVA